MARRVLPIATLLVAAFALAGCSLFQRPQRPAWRTQAEKACFAQKQVQFSSYVALAREIDGPGICGLTMPLKVTALAGGTVAIATTQTIGCPMTAALDQWIAEFVQPAALKRFGMPVTEVKSMGSYACRSMNNQGVRISEHGFGNAIDIGGFILADGREITFVKDWTRGDGATKTFLREIQAGACQVFTTVLAPGSDVVHYNHMHVDLAMHGNTSEGPRRICKPLPAPGLMPPRQRLDDLPDPPELEEDIDIAGLIEKTQPKMASQSLSASGVRSVQLGLPPAPPPQMRTRVAQAQTSIIEPRSPIEAQPIVAPPARLEPMTPLDRLLQNGEFLPPGAKIRRQ
jgi:hypothetical protein